MNTMNTETHHKTIASTLTIIGLELRTDNEVAGQTIPAHWQNFAEQKVLERIPNALSSDVYAVYTHYQNPGQNNLGIYSCVIGAAVSSGATVPEGLIAIELPASSYQIVQVPTGRPDLVGETWASIWQQDPSSRTFIADFERYDADGTIEIWLGVRF
jgi:predicted transcriptional regulator YdeE